MSAYGHGFAAVYNRQWAGFARRVAPLVLDHYEKTAPGQKSRTLLDLCCGTGQFALEALNRGYRVTGVDLSDAMLHHARENAAPYIESGQAGFAQGDARNLTIEGRFGLCVSTFDALNHLDSEEDLRSCFRSVFPLVEEGGLFVFDLNTRGRLRRWTDITVADDPEMLLVNRSLFVEHLNKAFVRITGFVRTPDGLYERFEETLYNTAFAMEDVRQMLLDAGWKRVHLAGGQDLSAPLPEPEAADRVWFVAGK